MSETILRPVATTPAAGLRLIKVGIGTATVGLVILGITSTFATTVSGGDFHYAGDYWLTAAALPLGVGMVLHAVGLHLLQGRRDGRLGTVGTWLFALCSLEIVVQCMASVAVGSELRWGPTYVLCAFGSFVGLALVAAGSWRVGLLPRRMLGVWPPLMLLGSWGGQSLVPILFAAFLIASGVVLSRRVAAAG